MNNEVLTRYFSVLRYSVDEKLSLGLDVSLMLELPVLSGQYQGVAPWNRLDAEPALVGAGQNSRSLEGLDICGNWSQDQSIYWGYYPILINDSGTYVVSRHFPCLSADAVHVQIDLAEKYGLAIGIAVQASSLLSSGPNAIIYADSATLAHLANDQHVLIETWGEKAWTYARLDFGSSEVRGYFGWDSHRIFKIKGADMPSGTLVRHGRVPCYPSIVSGIPIKPYAIVKRPELFEISRASDVGISFVGEPCLTYEDQCEGQDLLFSPTFEESDLSFRQSLLDYERLSKPSRQVIRHGLKGDSRVELPDPKEEQDIDLFNMLPDSVARSLSLVKENLPYDNICVLVSFLTCVAGVLRLGTKVTGNEMTNYKVPINLYTILCASSGRKKSALQELFVDQPAADVLLQVAQQNDRIMRKWQEDSRGQKSADKPPQPVPLDIRVNDYTGEAFVQALAKLDEEGRAVSVVREEISGLFDSFGEYKSGKGADAQQLLELYDGRGFRSLRVSDKGRAFSRAAVNIYGTIQPDVLNNLLRNGDASGMWARFCFAALPDLSKKLPTKSNPEQLSAFQHAQQYLRKMVSTVFELPALEYKLDPEAMELFAEYEFKKQEDALSTKIQAQAALFGKSAGKVLRFAGILHILRFTVNQLPPSELISREILQKAIELVDRLDRWTLGCHAKLAGLTPASLTSFERRLHNIALKSKSPMSWTDIRNKMSSDERKGKDVKAAEEAMKKLVALGLGEITRGQNGGLHYQALKPISA